MIVLPKIFAACFTLIFALLSSLGAVSPRQSAWALDLPVYEGGQIGKSVYLDGSGLCSDEFGPTGGESRMQTVRFTTREQYDAYCETLTEAGCRSVYENTLGGVTCAAFRKEDKLYYTCFAERKNEARVIEDNVTNCYEDFGYKCPGDGAVVYQFDLPYLDHGERDDEALYSDNGMLYVIRLADNSVIVVDGGSIRQSSDQNVDECMKFLRCVTGTEPGEPIRVALWYGTHGHSDHVTFFYKLLGHYHDEILLERVMFNYPSLSLVEHDGRVDMFRERLAQLYPDVRYLCPHTGMSFPMGSVTVDVLYTHEDAVSASSGKTPVKNPNDGSTVCRITAAGKRLLITGDVDLLAQDKLLALHHPRELKADVLQAPHHLYNNVALLYRYADAAYVLCPMSEGHGKTLWGYQAARLFYGKDQLLFAGDALYGVTLNANGLTISTGHTDCGPYDDSSMNEIRASAADGFHAERSFFNLFTKST